MGSPRCFRVSIVFVCPVCSSCVFVQGSVLKVLDLNWVGKKMEDQGDSGSVSGRTLASPKSHVKVGFLLLPPSFLVGICSFLLFPYR